MKQPAHATMRSRQVAILAIMAVGTLACFVENAAAFQSRIASPAGQGWAMAEVIADGALIHQSPNDAAYVTDEAYRGDLLWIREIAPESEWVRVRPPAGALSWILESDISEIRTGEGRVRVGQARIRPGRTGARLPGPPGVDLASGATVWLLPREPLVIPQRNGLMTWRAIEPPSIEPRFVRKEFLRKIAEKKRPEPDGFIAAKGPGTLAALDEPPAGLAEDEPAAGGVPGDLPAGRPGAMNDPLDPGEDLAAGPAGEKPANRIEILEIPETLTGQSVPPDRMENAQAPAPQDGVPPFGDLGSAASSRPAGPASPLDLPDDPDAALETLESRFRILMSEPLVSWDFRPILLACESLATRELTAIQAGRLNRLKTMALRQEDIGRSSREFWNSMRRSRSHDPSGPFPDTPIPARSAPRFDISGLLLPSRRDIDGYLLYNLIGDTGLTIAYLKMPPAAPVEKWLGKKVGIRGRVRYHEDLRGRLVTVQDVELLEPESP